MQYSPPIPFVDATQNNVAHPNALKPGSEFVRLTMYTGERDPVPTWPWPTYTWGIADGGSGYITLHGASPTLPTNILTTNFHPAHSSSPNCADWFQLGAYTVGVAPTGSLGYGQIHGANVIVWDAPGPIAGISATNYPSPYTTYGLATAATPGMWDVNWTITTHLYPGGFYYAGITGGWQPVDGSDPVNLINTYYTGAGSETLANVTTLEYAIVSGQTAVLFDDKGIGQLSYTGDWNIPFDFNRRIDNYQTCGWPVNVNGWVYFCDVGGKLFRTDGSYAIEVGGGYFPGVQKSTALFNVKMIPEITGATDATSHSLLTWPDTLANAENWMQFDGDNHRLVVNVRYKDTTAKSAGLAMVEMNTGTFQFLPDATNLDNGADLATPRVETGGIPLGKPSDRTHVAYVDVDFEIIGDPTDLSMIPGDAVDLTSQGNDSQRLTGPGGVYSSIPPSWVNPATDAIGTVGAYWITGTAVNYTAGIGPAIGGLTDGQTYYVISTGSDVQLSLTATITSGTSLTVSATEAFTGVMVDGPPTYILASGRQGVRVWVNKLVSKIPRFRITLNNPPAGIKCRIWGIHRIAFEQGGQLP